MTYRVKIESFEGPFQLLLALVSEQKVDIGALSISQVTDQYLAYMEEIRDLDMEVASDFLVVASTLLAIKASALLPVDELADFDEEFEELSPLEARDILVARLIAYKQFKNVAAALSQRLEAESRMHARQTGLEPEFIGLLPDFLERVTLQELAALSAALVMRRRVFLLDAEHITAKPVAVEERLDDIIAVLSKKKKLLFDDLLKGSAEPITVVVNFLALLELYHRGMIDLDQEEHFGSISVAYREKKDWAPAPDVEKPPDTVIEYLESLEHEGDSDE